MDWIMSAFGDYEHWLLQSKYLQVKKHTQIEILSHFKLTPNFGINWPSKNEGEKPIPEFASDLRQQLSMMLKDAVAPGGRWNGWPKNNNSFCLGVYL